jgi:hypothetical protein
MAAVLRTSRNCSRVMFEVRHKSEPLRSWSLSFQREYTDEVSAPEANIARARWGEPELTPSGLRAKAAPSMPVRG